MSDIKPPGGIQITQKVINDLLAKDESTYTPAEAELFLYIIETSPRRNAQ